MWFELQTNCYECAGNSQAFRTLDDVAEAIITDSWYSFKPVQVRTLHNGLPKTIDIIGFNVSDIEDIEWYDYRTEAGEEVITYSFTNNYGTEKVLFLFDKPAVTAVQA